MVRYLLVRYQSTACDRLMYCQEGYKNILHPISTASTTFAQKDCPHGYQIGVTLCVPQRQDASAIEQGLFEQVAS